VDQYPGPEFPEQALDNTGLDNLREVVQYSRRAIIRLTELAVQYRPFFWVFSRGE
jgi:hypothetical protein